LASAVQNMGIDIPLRLDSVPVSVPQIAGGQRTFTFGSKDQKIAATGSLYCGTGMGKRKNVPENVK
jgi:hypothetical protein